MARRGDAWDWKAASWDPQGSAFVVGRADGALVTVPLRGRVRKHHVSPHVVSIDGDTAKASTPVHAVHLQIRNDNSHNHWVIAAVYHDELVRTGEGWRIKQRRAMCPYVEGDFLIEGVRLFPTLPDLDREGAP